MLIRSHLLYLAVLLLIIGFVGWPLFQPYQMQGHDSFAYLPRMEEFYQQLQSGILFPRWAPDFSAGYGQPLFNFIPPMIYYISSLFHFFRFSFVVSENLTALVILLLSGIGMYVLANEFFGKRGALVAAAAYLLGPYLLVNLYVRHALMDFSAFAFMPFAWWGLYKFCLKGNVRFLVTGVLAMAALLLSANPIALISYPSLAVFLIFLFWIFHGQRWLILKRGVWCFGLALGLAAIFWIPAFFERDLVHTTRLITGGNFYQDHFVYLYQMVYSKWGYGDSVPGPGDGMSFGLGFVQLISVAAALFLNKRLAAISTAGWLAVTYFLIILGAAVFFTSDASVFIWNRLTILQYFQFPWRFLSLATLSTALICGFPFLFIKTDHVRLANGLMILMLAALLIQSYSHTQPSGYNFITDADYSPSKIAASHLPISSFEEYESIWMEEEPIAPAAERVILTGGTGQINNIQSSPTRLEFMAVITAPARIRVNTTYFPGWVLTVDNLPARLSYDNPQGAMEFPLSSGTHQVSLQFRDTKIQQVSGWISGLALVLLVLTPRITKKIFY